jgi:hypothetical protein
MSQKLSTLPVDVKPQVPADNCSCGRLHIGMQATELHNWSPDCPAHGTKSNWYQTEEAKTLRDDIQRLSFAL